MIFFKNDFVHLVLKNNLENIWQYEIFILNL